MLSVASPTTLDKYAEGIRRPYATHRQWTVSMAADDRLRREQWGVMAEKVHAEPPTANDPTTPWNIIREPAYSLTTSLAEWWWFHPPQTTAAIRRRRLPPSKGSGR